MKKEQVCKFQGFHSGIIMDYTLLGCEAVSSGKWFLIFGRNMLLSLLRVNQQHSDTSQKIRIPRNWFVWGSYNIDAQIIICSAGRPLTPRLMWAKIGADGRSLDIEWQIISYSPILEYRVQYKNTKASSSVVIIFC
jgi:hypothetical protein